ncbi:MULTISPECIES: hypothetical protein [unclassified Duganella]|jgi:hypothetical protein|uniref:hypothetical protein n=1 Tax=unclassified Duganella TaxID=2636909 RepID=UPI00088FBA42|nr:MULTISPECIES: hypothetical protein [unclassified Duganella]SDG28163.1 hypothetical protein SAMN05216320_103490 [Duganella sp. OV458]
MKAFLRDVSHHESLLRELKADPKLAAEYFKLAIQALATEEDVAGGLRALTTLQEAFESLKNLASEARLNDIPAFETAAEYRDWSLQHI